MRNSVIILQRPGQGRGGFGIGFPAGEAVLEAGEVLADGDEGFAVGPGVLHLGLEPGAAGLGTGVGLGDFPDGKRAWWSRLSEKASSPACRGLQPNSVAVMGRTSLALSLGSSKPGEGGPESGIGIRAHRSPRS